MDEANTIFGLGMMWMTPGFLAIIYHSTRETRLSGFILGLTLSTYAIISFMGA